jgi:hypothetical protein
MDKGTASLQETCRYQGVTLRITITGMVLVDVAVSIKHTIMALTRMLVIIITIIIKRFQSGDKVYL